MFGRRNEDLGIKAADLLENNQVKAEKKPRYGDCKHNAGAVHLCGQGNNQLMTTFIDIQTARLAAAQILQPARAAAVSVPQMLRHEICC